MTVHSDATLLGWLANHPDKLERHLERHPEDIDRLDRLTELPAQQVAAMHHSVSAPDDIAERVISRMRIDPQLKEAGATFADLFTLGIRTVQVVFGPTDRPGDESNDDTTDDNDSDERTEG